MQEKENISLSFFMINPLLDRAVRAAWSFFKNLTKTIYL